MLHFLVIAAQEKDPAKQIFIDSTEVHLHADNEAAAIEKAKVLAPGRAVYFVRQVLEDETTRKDGE